MITTFYQLDSVCVCVCLTRKEGGRCFMHHRKQSRFQVEAVKKVAENLIFSLEL